MERSISIKYCCVFRLKQDRAACILSGKLVGIANGLFSVKSEAAANTPRIGMAFAVLVSVKDWYGALPESVRQATEIFNETHLGTRLEGLGTDEGCALVVSAVLPELPGRTEDEHVWRA